MTDASPQNLGSLAFTGVLWSIVQNWGGKLFTLVLFVVLARFLTPADYGTVAAAALVLMLMQALAEFGFCDALVQRRNLAAADANLPFYAALGAAALLAVAMLAGANHIERLFGVAGLAPVLLAMALILPLNTATAFQEAHYRRSLAFKPLALRTFAANLIAGIAAIAFAAAGAGVWSLVAQAYLAALVGFVWLWRKPLWRPGRGLHVHSFRQLAAFGLLTVGQRLVDFVATRLVEVIIIGRFGLVAYGLYVVGSRLYQTMMQLLQSALHDVSFTVLSRMSQETERMAGLYLRSITLSVYLAAPLFVLVAAVAPELCAILFGAKWQGVEEVAAPMLLLGALQCVQFMNGPYLAARGRPGLILYAGLAKAVAAVVALTLVPADGIAQTTHIFVLSQLAATPLSFGFVLSELKVLPGSLLRILGPGLLANLLAFIATLVARSWISADAAGPFPQGLLLGAVFAAAYMSMAALLARGAYREIHRFFRQRIEAA